MADYAFLLPIGIALLGGAMSPGPSFLVVAQQSLSQSSLHGILTSLGTASAAACFALLAALGVTGLLESMPKAYALFRFVGGCYLLWLAYCLFANAKQPLPERTLERDKVSLLASLAKGFAVQISNPKTVFIIASIFSAALPQQLPSYTALWVTLTAFVVDFSWYALVAWSLSKAPSRAFYQRRKHRFDYMASALLALLALKLFYDLFA